jgi:hypothetical protein
MEGRCRCDWIATRIFAAIMVGSTGALFNLDCSIFREVNVSVIELHCLNGMTAHVERDLEFALDC